MARKTFYMLGILLTIVLGSLLYSKLCYNYSLKKQLNDTSIVPDPNFFTIKGSNFEFHTNTNFNFYVNKGNLILPIDDSIDIGIEKLKKFFILNPNKKLVITGFLTSNEVNTPEFKNLGLARAQEVKKYFILKGLSTLQLEAKGEISDDWRTFSYTVYGPVTFHLAQREKDPSLNNDLILIKEKIKNEPLNQYFETNKSSRVVKETFQDVRASVFSTRTDKEKFEDIKLYMANVKDASVLIVGYTDNVGNKEYNLILAQKRAEFSKNYLTKNGIEASRIVTESKGSNEPIGNNTSVHERDLSRRTVITIK